MITKTFMSGNSLAVRIPKALADDYFGHSSGQTVEISKSGDALILRPVGQDTLSGVGEIFRSFSADFMTQGRDESPEISRLWDNDALSA